MSIPPLPMANLTRRLFATLASIRLAIALMAALGFVCVIATFFESRHGTPAAQRAFYGTWWFALLLALLAGNVLASMLKRLPWRKHHVGFVLAHLGILLILGGSLVSIGWGMDSQLAVYEGDATNRVSLAGQALRVTGIDATAPVDVRVDFASQQPHSGRELRFAIPGSDAHLVAEDYYAHASVSDELEEGTRGGPALHFVLSGDTARADDWLVADDPERRSVTFGPLTLSLHVARTDGELKKNLERSEGANHARFVIGPRGELHYRLDAAQGGSRGVLALGAPLPTPWMGLKLQVDRVLAHAETRRSVSAAPPHDHEDHRIPAVKARLEGASWRSASQWLVWGDAIRLETPSGVATVSFGRPERSLPFQVALLRFNSDKYPGSSMPATYESFVRVEDPERGVSEHHIAMNKPLHYRGYVFFQASYVEGTPMMSVLSVARAPGLPAVYSGTALLSVGVFWMFFWKPFLLRRQGRAALAARQASAAANA